MNKNDISFKYKNRHLRYLAIRDIIQFNSLSDSLLAFKSVYDKLSHLLHNWNDTCIYSSNSQSTTNYIVKSHELNLVDRFIN